MYPRMTLTIALTGLTLLAICGCKRDPSGAVLPGALAGDASPVSARPADPGILAPQEKYQPAKVVGGGGRSGGGAVSGDAASQVTAALSDFNKHANDQELSAAITSFDEATVLALGGADSELVSQMTNTFELISTLRSRLNTALGEEKAPAILDAIPTWRKAPPKLDMLDENTVNITTDLPQLLFGAPHGGLRASKNGDKWTFQLGTALTASDTAAIKTYHETLQKAIDDITIAVEKQTLKDEAQIKSLLTDAIAGKPIAIAPGEGGATPEPGAGGNANATGAAPGADANANANSNAAAGNDNAGSSAANTNSGTP